MSERLDAPGAAPSRGRPLSRGHRSDRRRPSRHSPRHRGRARHAGKAGVRRLPAREHRQRHPRSALHHRHVARIGQLQRGLAGMQLLLHGERRGIAIHCTEKDGYLQAVVREAEEMPPSTWRTPRSWPSTARPAPAPPSWARSRACRRKWSIRSWPGSTSPAASPISSPATSTSRRASGRRCWRRCRSRSGSAACWCTCSGRSACSMRRRTSSRRCRRSWASGSGRCSSASSSRPSAASWARTSRGDEVEELRAKLEALNLPPEARKEVDRELGRLSRIGRESMESQVVRTYLENIAELPWNVRSRRAPRPQGGRADPRGGSLRAG